jgi:hypothetical protein
VSGSVLTGDCSLLYYFLQSIAIVVNVLPPCDQAALAAPFLSQSECKVMPFYFYLQIFFKHFFSDLTGKSNQFYVLQHVIAAKLFTTLTFVNKQTPDNFVASTKKNIDYKPFYYNFAYSLNTVFI